MPSQALNIGSLQYPSELIDCKEEQTREMLISYAVLRNIAGCCVSQCDRKIPATRNYQVLQDLELDISLPSTVVFVRLLAVLHSWSVFTFWLGLWKRILFTGCSFGVSY
jgi:hypothetical protein